MGDEPLNRFFCLLRGLNLPPAATPDSAPSHWFEHVSSCISCGDPVHEPEPLPAAADFDRQPRIDGRALQSVCRIGYGSKVIVSFVVHGEDAIGMSSTCARVHCAAGADVRVSDVPALMCT